MSRAGFAATDRVGAWPVAISPEVALGETVGNEDGWTVFFGTVSSSQAFRVDGTNVQALGSREADHGSI